MEILLLHLSQCMQPEHWLTLTKVVLTSKWTSPTQSKQSNQTGTTMCSSGGRPHTAAVQRSLHAKPTGEPLQLNLSFYFTDKQQFPESLSPPLSKFTWGLGASAHVSGRGQSKCVFTHTQPNENEKYNFPLKHHSVEKQKKKWKCLNAQIYFSVHTL